ncbi:hypothetical protein BH11ARM2_BH11ARM2_15630 [soil metagenome]
MFEWKWTAKTKMASAMALATVGGSLCPLRPVVFLGGSMSPTYADASVAWGTRDVGTLHRGDVVVVDTPVGRIVKRVALLAGDGYWEMRHGGDWFSVLEVVNTKHKVAERFVAVPPGQVFLVGDNRMISIDSRTFGPVPLENVRLKLVAPQGKAGGMALYGAVLRKNFVLRTQKPVVE